MVVLITGGAGYIGTHTLVKMIEAGNQVVVLDNLSNSKETAIRRVEAITGTPIMFYCGDIRDEDILNHIFSSHKIDSVIHFAGLKAVGESVSEPLLYYDNNVSGTITLCSVMGKYGVKNLVFSSSATVYGDPESLPITEDAKTGATNPYGQSKLMVELMLADLYKSDPEWNIAVLRYFNPVGAHESGMIGEDPSGIPNNLMPFITQVASGKREAVNVFGNDYDTPDGSGVRDYIHVVDLADAHVKALIKLAEAPGIVVYNLGTGKGYSVFEMIEAVKKASKTPIPYIISGRRSGDIAACYANPELANSELGWKAAHSLDDMANSSWKWQMMNPKGFGDQ
jgi:UDP-glucose 4-epimerase